MKYFTPAWHRGDLDDEASDQVWVDYQRHLAGLLSNLPPEVQTLATRISLHDGLLWKVAADPERGLLRLALRCGDLQVGYFDLELDYAGVESSPGLTEALRWLPVIQLGVKSRHSGEALYDEVDQEGGLLEHHILFWQTDWRHRQAARRLRRQRRDSRRPKRYGLRLKGNFYQELVIRFKGLRIMTTPRNSRHEVDALAA